MTAVKELQTESKKEERRKKKAEHSRHRNNALFLLKGLFVDIHHMIEIEASS